jgi:diguanylate cyclase (GGDEF)-like protein
MLNGHYQFLTPEEIELVIKKLEYAIAEHTRWLNDLYRSRICGLPVAEIYLKKNAHHLCKFGRWYHNTSSPVLMGREDFILIDRLHRAMHASARILAIKTKQGENITVKDYDTFIKKEEDLSTGLLKLRNEMRDNLFAFDYLTGLLNRQSFFTILIQEHARVVRTGRPCCISMVDIDHFKIVNDTYGHLAGDKVLQETTQCLIQHRRPYDSICRYGGEEFLICLPGTVPDTARKILERLRTRISSMSIVLDRNRSINITVSFGIAEMEPDVSITDTISRADESMYAAKNGGRNRICIWGEWASLHQNETF